MFSSLGSELPLEPQRAVDKMIEIGLIEVRGDDKCHIRSFFHISAIFFNQTNSYTPVRKNATFDSLLFLPSIPRSH